MPDGAEIGQEARSLTSVEHTIAEVIGVEATLKLSAAFPGKKLYVPRSLSNNHPIALAIGIEDALKLSAAFTCDYLDLPTASIRPNVKASVQRLADQGMTPSQIAAETGVTPRWVRMVLYDDQPHKFGRTRQKVLSETGTSTEIAKKLGLSEVRVAAVLKRYRGGNQ